MKTIQITQGYSAIVDDEEYSELSKHKWYYANGYAYRKINKKQTSMHEIIMGRNWVDHKNLNRLDNRKSNLRLTDRSLNTANSKKSKSNSPYKGITKKGNSWQVFVRGKYCGIFKDAKEAALKYNEVAEAEFGEFARGNIL